MWAVCHMHPALLVLHFTLVVPLHLQTINCLMLWLKLALAWDQSAWFFGSILPGLTASRAVKTSGLIICYLLDDFSDMHDAVMVWMRMFPQAHIFVYLVYLIPSYWDCSERIRKWDLIWRCVTAEGGGLWVFKRLVTPSVVVYLSVSFLYIKIWAFGYSDYHAFAIQLWAQTHWNYKFQVRYFLYKLSQSWS